MNYEGNTKSMKRSDNGEWINDLGLVGFRAIPYFLILPLILYQNYNTIYVQMGVTKLLSPGICWKPPFNTILFLICILRLFMFTQYIYNRDSFCKSFI